MNAAMRHPGAQVLRDLHAAAVPHTVGFALAGCGVVGSALLRLLRERGPSIEARHGLRLVPRTVLVRDPRRARDAGIAPGLFTDDLARFSDTSGELLVEAIGGIEPARGLIERALAAGRDVITANKAVVAMHGAALQRLAVRHGAGLDFEAAVGGGVPLVQVLRDNLAETGVQAIRGILNGTSNYILCRLAEGVDFTTALAQAQAAGFAEADPARDLDGRDVADKIRILAWLAFGTDPARLQVETAGILPDPDALARQARAKQGVVRLIAECALIQDRVCAWVRPLIVAPDSPWAQVRDEENLVLVDTRFNGTVHLRGPGAGGEATASALLADLVRRALWRRQRQAHSPFQL